LLRYQDGRFATDKLFGFYATNFIIRERNNRSGRWFVNKHHDNCPHTLEELKKQIEEGDTNFVRHLTFYSEKVKGSTGYWFKKRNELQTWIYHHVQQGNGAPMFFITLSCAEYLWPDIIDLIRERMELAGQDSSGCKVGSPTLAKILNEYSIVVQEYFQKRVVEWLDSVGKKILRIKHYWVRYEFAPGRGQIHAHLMAISSDNSIYTLCHIDMQQRGSNGEEARANRLCDWASKTFGLTATVSDDFDNKEVNQENTPVRIRFLDVPKLERQQDAELLMKHVQMHRCSKFCMRDAKDKT
jgi:hypothetical protein